MSTTTPVRGNSLVFKDDTHIWRLFEDRQDPPSAREIAQRVDTAGDRAIRFLGGALVATTAALIASYGIIASVAVFGFGYLVTPLIVMEARNKVANPNSLLTTAGKVELLLEAALWKETILAAICLGAGVGSLYYGMISIFSGSSLSVLKGSMSTIMGAHGLLSGVQGFDAYNSRVEQVNVERLIGVCDALKTTQPSQEIGACILELNELEWNQSKIRDEMERFLITHPQFSIFDLAEHLSDRYLLDYFGPLSELLDKNARITGKEIVTRLPEALFREYISFRQSSLEYLSELSDETSEQNWEQIVLTTVNELRKKADSLSSRLDRLPKNDELSFDNVEPLYTTNCNTLIEARKKLSKMQAFLAATDEAILAAVERVGRGEDVETVMQELVANS